MKIRFNSANISGTSSGGRVAGKGCGTLFFGLFLLMGMVFVVLILGEGLQQIAPWRWVETPCTILTSTVAETDDEEDPYRPLVRYRYEVDGRSYESNQLSRGSGTTASYDRARDQAARYRPGAPATCWVDPDHPALSVLERRPPWISSGRPLPDDLRRHRRRRAVGAVARLHPRSRNPKSSRFREPHPRGADTDS